MRTRRIRHISWKSLIFAFFAAADLGCGSSPTRPSEDDVTSSELPPAYTRDIIIDPKLDQVAKTFTGWAEAQKAGDARVFLRVEVLPPAPTLLPYGIGTYQKETRLPAILITGPGWSVLKLEEREAMAARAFEDLSGRLAAIKLDAPIRPSVTIQTSQGLELAWINQLEPGGKYLHGENE
jgi:hypothetical protein